MPRRRVFVSYHFRNDQKWRKRFDTRFGGSAGVVEFGGVEMGEIPDGLKTETVRQRIRDEFLRRTSVTIVLIGTQTWQRKHVDWEISSSLRHTDLNPRSGLLGLFLPTHPSYGQQTYDKGIVPPRLYDNAAIGYAVMAHWSDDPHRLAELVSKAYNRKTQLNPTNRRPMFGNNRTAPRWDA